ncbi:Oidioi.mRNA.OKI2018_I69.XSR.g15315.t1.cds [Oikopleura dioica]|uniref:Oidioi.mRNA.OKI2018_I69.XSR.g15315.t1.cds n=1 Tax=Oikopleura dioica TaxID=34765 RepID=A0ABN7SHN2_OIKDI|nr:Oidioi.mRNA.OKI2018_I69.XSR.g15315.t1.cds [Oikopleura dioica]
MSGNKTREEYVKKFAKYGIEASVDEVFGTAYLASYYFTKNPPNGKLYVMGNSGIQGELANVKGLEIVTEETAFKSTSIRLLTR